MPNETNNAPDNQAQAEFWASASGRKWATHQARLDRLFSEVTDELLQRCDAKPGESVIDIGCGTGETTLAFARQVGPTGQVLGVDISPVLVDFATRRDPASRQASFHLADAQFHSFARGQTDLLASRFGVMFFADPVAAFENMARALRPGARCVFACWAPQPENPWFVAPQAAATARLGPLPPMPEGSPGPFGFSDRARVLGILTQAGFENARAEVCDLFLHCDGTSAQAAELATQIGPVSRIMKHHDGTETDRIAIAEAVTDTFAAFALGGSVRVPARINFYSASRPST